MPNMIEGLARIRMIRCETRISLVVRQVHDSVFGPIFLLNTANFKHRIIKSTPRMRIYIAPPIIIFGLIFCDLR